MAYYAFEQSLKIQFPYYASVMLHCALLALLCFINSFLLPESEYKPIFLTTDYKPLRVLNFKATCQFG